MNSNTNFVEYLKLCAKRMYFLLFSALIVFAVVLFATRILTPVQYTVTGTILLQSDVTGESISDQYNISELAKSAALTSISLVDNSDTVQKALSDSRITDEDPAEFQKRVTVEQVNDSNVLKVTLVFDSDRTQAETFMANLLSEGCALIQETFADYNPSFTGVIEDAGRVTDISSPWLTALIAALIAVLADAILFFIFNIFSFAADRTLRTSSKLDNFTRIPVIAAIPSSAHFAGVSDNMSQLGNAYRVLRSSIKYSKDNVRTIAVCSPSPRDGRTSVAIGLSQALADTNAMVLLIEADMHRPNISKELRFDPVFGLGDLLLGKTNLAATICKTSNRNLYVITAVNNVNMNNIDVCDLLDSSVFDELLEAVESQFDYVIIDTPSIELLPDAATVAGKVDGSIIVAQYGHTRTDALRFALDVFSSIDCNILGIVTTNSPRRSGVFGSVSRYYRSGNSRSGEGVFTTLLDNFFGVVNMVKSRLPSKKDKRGKSNQ